ncbi:hypothetical protein KBD61_00680 [Patescibacteria group bacterium]|nr:hypothetical protein [Patescibacteria group bacterium]
MIHKCLLAALLIVQSGCYIIPAAQGERLIQRLQDQERTIASCAQRNRDLQGQGQPYRIVFQMPTDAGSSIESDAGEIPLRLP